MEPNGSLHFYGKILHAKMVVALIANKQAVFHTMPNWQESLISFGDYVIKNRNSLSPNTLTFLGDDMYMMLVPQSVMYHYMEMKPQTSISRREAAVLYAQCQHPVACIDPDFDAADADTWCNMVVLIIRDMNQKKNDHDHSIVLLYIKYFMFGFLLYLAIALIHR